MEAQPTYLQQLQAVIPGAAGQLEALTQNNNRHRGLRDEMSATHQRIRQLEDDERQTVREADELARDIIGTVHETDTLDTLGKIALLSAIDDVNGLTTGLYRPGMKSETLFYHINRRYGVIDSSLRRLTRLAVQPNLPVMYCEINGGESMYTGGGLDLRPRAHHFFSGRTVGNGVQAELSPSYPERTISFHVKNGSKPGLRNFISGYTHQDQEGLQITVNHTQDIAATATRADMMLRHSVHEGQTNALFVGEVACAHAKEFIVSRMRVIDNDVSRLLPRHSQPRR